MIRVAPSFVRLAVPAAAVLLSAGALVGCGSSPSSSGTPSTSASVSVSTSISTSVQAGALPSNLSALCTGLNSSDLASLSHATDPTSALQAWNKLAADAPDAIKGDMQTVATFLQATVDHDYTKLQGAMTSLQTAITHISTYIGTNCHS